MARIVISENVTLDGVVQDPAGDEGFRHGGWVGLIRDLPQLSRLALDEALVFGSDAHEPSSVARRFAELAATAEAAGFHPGRYPHDFWRRKPY